MSARYHQGLLDTNVLILWGSLDRSSLPNQLAISAVTLAELVAGLQEPRGDDLPAQLERAQRAETLQRVESQFDPLPFDVQAARAYGRVCAATRSAGRNPRGRIADLMIASTAVAAGLPLYTANPADFAGLETVLDIVAVHHP